jgi:hypothetical protein
MKKKLFFIVALVMAAGTIIPADNTENSEPKKNRTWNEWWNDTKKDVPRPMLGGLVERNK